MRRVQRAAFYSLLIAAAGCDGACLTQEGPSPMPFDSALRVPAASQIRFTPRGLQLGSEALTAGLLPLNTQIPIAGSGTGYTLCPDARPCALTLSVQSAGLATTPPDELSLTMQVDLSATDIPVQVAGFDCAFSVTSSATAQLPVQLRNEPGGAYLGFLVGAATTNQTLASITLGPDPVLGDATDALECPRLSVPNIGQALIDQALLEAPPLVEQLLGDALGPSCGSCPAPATCTDYCRGAAGEMVLEPELIAGRFIVPSLLGGLGYAGEPGKVDIEVRAGPGAGVDTAGLLVPIAVGTEPTARQVRCAQAAQSPVSLPSFAVPPALPNNHLADLDNDGTPETEYDVALSISRAVVTQLGYGLQQVGAICGSIGQEVSDDVHTGQLQILIPSVRFLTNSHVEPRSERPVRISVRQASPPRVELGQGERNAGGSFIEPHVHLYLDDIQLDVSIFLEERWIRLLTIDADLHLGVAAETTAQGGFQPLVGVGVAEPVSRLRVTNTELLRETPEDLEATVPTLVSLLLGEAGGAQGEIDVPDVYGLQLRVLGLRSEPDAQGVLQNLVAYLEVPPPGSGGNLGLQVQTKAELVRVDVPKTEAFAVTYPGGPTPPSVDLKLSTEAPAGQGVEHQVRIDNKAWGPYQRGTELHLSSAQWLLQGRHSVEVRSRVIGHPQSEDPTPVRFDFWIDSEAPDLSWSWADSQHITADVHDAISPPVSLRFESADQTWPAELNTQGRLRVPNGAQTLIARDQAGNEVTETIRGAASGSSQDPGGCRNTAPIAPLMLVLGLALGLIRRRR